MGGGLGGSRPSGATIPPRPAPGAFLSQIRAARCASPRLREGLSAPAADLEKLQPTPGRGLDVATERSPDGAPRSSLPVGGCPPGNGRSAYSHRCDAAAPGAARRATGRKFTSSCCRGAASPLPARWKQVAKQPDAAQLRPGNSPPTPPTQATGEAPAAGANRDSNPAATGCQSCFSSRSKLTRRRRGLLGGGSPPRRDSVEGAGRTVPAATGAWCCDSRCSRAGSAVPGAAAGEAGPAGKRGRPGFSPRLPPLRAPATPGAPRSASSPAAASAERGRFVGRRDPLVVYDSLILTRFIQALGSGSHS